jgi:hypothetical protein
MDSANINAKPITETTQPSESKRLADLNSRFQQLRERKAQKQKPAALAEFPNWPTAMRGTPNVCLRSALFAGIQGNERMAYKKRTLLASVEGIEVRYLGIQLNQSDLDVWMHIVHLSRQQLPGYSIVFSAHALLKALGKGSGKSQHEWLKESMARLGGAFVELTFHGRDSFGGKGFLRYYRDEVTQRYVVELTESMLRLFDGGYTYVEFKQRQQLRKQPLALWLHGFLSSHASLYPLKIQTLHRLSGSVTQNLRDFKMRLRRALELMLEIGIVESFVFEDDSVKIKKSPTPSQQRFLSGKQVG